MDLNVLHVSDHQYHRVHCMCAGEGFSVAFDPLDGSSIVDTNFTVGTIFGVWPGDKLIGVTGRDQVTQPLLDPTSLHYNSANRCSFREFVGFLILTIA